MKRGVLGRLRQLRNTCVALGVLAFAGIGPVSALVIDDGVILPGGQPTWRLADIQLFAGTIGTPANSFEDFALLTRSILPLPNHVPCPDPTCSVTPGAVHSGYDHELSDGLTSLGIASRTVFSADEFTGPKGVILGWMIVPTAGAPTGSSVDGLPGGLIIPNGLFPMNVDGDLYRNGVLYDAAFDFQAVGIVGVDGYSHYPLFIAENKDISGSGISDPLGLYEFRITMTDQSGRGWTHNVGFQVVPLPGALWLFGSGLVAVLAWGRRRLA